MNAIVVSDLHVGSPHFRADLFESFLEKAPDHGLLILNGDIVHNFGREIPERQMATLGHIAAISKKRQVVWISGNHDRGYLPPETGSIEFTESFSIGKRLLAFHGDRILPMKRLFRIVSLAMRPILIRVDTQHASVRLAKAIPFFFRYLADRLMANAVRIAAAGGYEAVACGHIHSAMEKMSEGIFYVNTGTWTDSSSPFLLVEEDRMSLREYAATTA